MIEHISILQAIYSSLTCYNIWTFSTRYIYGHVFLFFRRAGRVFLFPAELTRFPFFRRARRVFLFFRREGHVFFFSAQLGAFSFLPIHSYVQRSITTHFVIFFHLLSENLNRFIEDDLIGDKPSWIYIYALYK